MPKRYSNRGFQTWMNSVCERYPGCVLVFERLHVINARGGGNASRKRNRKQANHLQGKINQLAKGKAHAMRVVSCETNAYGTSQYCSRCGAKRERFSRKGSVCIVGRRLS